MDRLLADHTGHFAVLAQDRDALTDEHLRVPPADRGDVHEAIIIDVCDLQADFIDVSCEHDSRTSRWVHHRERVARDVRVYAVRKGLGVLAPDASCADLEA